MSEVLSDEIYDLIDKLELAPAQALEALTGCIMGMTEQCADPKMALLAVIAELTNLVRFTVSPEKQEELYACVGKQERDDWMAANNSAPSLKDWIADAWDDPQEELSTRRSGM